MIHFITSDHLQVGCLVALLFGMVSCQETERAMGKGLAETPQLVLTVPGAINQEVAQRAGRVKRSFYGFGYGFPHYGWRHVYGYPYGGYGYYGGFHPGFYGGWW